MDVKLVNAMKVRFHYKICILINKLKNTRHHNGTQELVGIIIMYPNFTINIYSYNLLL